MIWLRFLLFFWLGVTFLSLGMIARYARPAMRDIWTEQRKLEIWLKIELLATEALVEQGLVPLRDFRKMKKGAAFSIDRCKELERTLNHDVIAFTTNVAENINDKASRWLHYGLTSSDLIDTAFAVQMMESVDSSPAMSLPGSKGRRNRRMAEPM